MGQKIYLYTINPLYINSYSILVDFYMPLISNQAISMYYYLENAQALDRVQNHLTNEQVMQNTRNGKYN